MQEAPQSGGRQAVADAVLAMQALVTDQKGNSDFPSTAATRAAADAALSSLQMAGAVGKLLRVRTDSGLHVRWDSLPHNWLICGLA